jgi:Adenosyl cobinamide kinase/adenosyl cobinamide phosphate guanylyltransferase
MILIIGGRGAGKKTYARQLGFSDRDFGDSADDGSPVLVGLHDLLRNHIRIEEDFLDEIQKKAVVICDEVGCGVVPMDPEERRWRDRVGRTCALLAARADKVVRLCCGIPQIIKGEEDAGHIIAARADARQP